MDDDRLSQHVRDLEARIFALEMRLWMRESTEHRRMRQPEPPPALEWRGGERRVVQRDKRSA